MFTFWRKPSTIHIDCFTSNRMVYEHFKIDKAIKFYPKEVKALPNYVKLKQNPVDPESKLTNSIPTLRKCYGVLDLFGNGMIMPAHCDFDIEVTKDGVLYYNDNISFVHGSNLLDSHDRIQYGSGIYQERKHAKILMPWYLKEKTGVKFTWNMCDWHRTDLADNIRILSGVLDFKHQHQLNVNCFIKKGSIVSYKAGDPLVHMIPISDKKIELHYHLLDRDEYNKLTSDTMLETSYKNHRKLKENAESKCPFGFK